MEIARDKPLDGAREKVRFCLDQLEKAEVLNGDINMSFHIVPRLRIEEIIGALVAAEQEFGDDSLLQEKK
jgi:hypothetical protein